MTSTTALTLNAVLAAIVVYGIVFLLAHGIHRDRLEERRRRAGLRPVVVRDRDEDLAA